jgi:SanA protein
MKNKKVKIGIAIIAGLLILFWLPFFFIKLTTQSKIINSISQLPTSDAIIIFGANVTPQKTPTPILQERLDAGKTIFDANKGNKLVVSNAKLGADIMAQYLTEQNISPELIEIDPQADKTTDTCKYEKQQYPNARKIIFVSQGYHLPRIIYQCQKIGVDGIGFPAENIESIDRSQYSLFTRLSIRTQRYAREAWLDWLAVLNIYK